MWQLQAQSQRPAAQAPGLGHDPLAPVPQVCEVGDKSDGLRPFPVPRACKTRNLAQGPGLLSRPHLLWEKAGGGGCLPTGGSVPEP